MKTLVLDTETTGLGAADRVCEIALIEIDNDFNIIETHSSLIDPEIPISAEASAINGITDEMVADKPTLTEFFTVCCEGKYTGVPVRLMCHNAPFDIRFVNHELHILDWICTLRLARRYIPEASNHKLETLQQLFQLPVEGQAHSALADTLTCLNLAKALAAGLSGGVKDLADLTHAAFDFRIMPFGKHKGSRIVDLPYAYRKFMASLDDIDPELRRALVGVRCVP